MRPYRLESRMRENRPSGLEGGGADIHSPYPYPGSGREIAELIRSSRFQSKAATTQTPSPQSKTWRHGGAFQSET